MPLHSRIWVARPVSLPGVILPAMTDRIPILLMACPIAGFQYHAGEAYWPELRPGDELQLCREHGNHYDARAIRVEWRGVPLGYVPREANFTVALVIPA